MGTAAVVKKEEPSYLEMSDEEIMNVDPSTLEATAEEEEGETVVEEGTEEDDPPEASNDSSTEDEQEEEQEDQDESESAEEATPETPPVEADVTSDQKEGESSKEEAGIDYKAEYERLLAPFKANGRELTVQSVDDAIALMQMGANYNKKMAALKPNLKLLKLLENNKLLSEEKLSFLIDLDKRNPDAIQKLVKDSGMDPLDLDAEKASGYKPQTYTVDDREIELDTVLDEIQGTPTYNRTLDIVSNKWDGASKNIIANSPQLLKVINTHLENGVYEIITAEIERESVFGRLNGLSNIEAYRQVGDAIQARGGFDHLVSQGQQAPKTPVVVTPKPKQVEDERLRDKKRAASSTKPVAPRSTPADFNPLAMSDEDFSKNGIDKFL